jgi:hypothetical protein
LAWALSSFERVVLFTSVAEPRARQVLRTLVEYGEAPPAAEHFEHVAWSGPVKDLSFVRDAAVEELRPQSARRAPPCYGAPHGHEATARG